MSNETRLKINQFAFVLNSFLLLFNIWTSGPIVLIFLAIVGVAAALYMIKLLTSEEVDKEHQER